PAAAAPPAGRRASPDNSAGGIDTFERREVDHDPAGHNRFFSSPCRRDISRKAETLGNAHAAPETAIPN
ncbi:MAG: hypothetical protein ABIR80_15975, partial [Opitutaceae bacterium]